MWALIRRDLLRSMRSVRLFLLFAFASAILTVILMSAYPRSGTGDLSTASRLAWTVTALFFSSIGAAAALLVPALAATSIVREREEDTFTLLASTLMRSCTLVAGSIAVSIGMLLLYTLASVPMLAVVFFLVGLDWQSVVMALIMTAAAAISAASICSAVSARAQSSLRALAVGYLLMVFVNGGQFVLDSLLTDVLLQDMLGIPLGMPAGLEEYLAFVLATPVAIAETLYGGATPFLLSLFGAYHALLFVLGILLAYGAPLRLRLDRPVAAPRRWRSIVGRARPRGYQGIGDHTNAVAVVDSREIRKAWCRRLAVWTTWWFLVVAAAWVIYALHCNWFYRGSIWSQPFRDWMDVWITQPGTSDEPASLYSEDDVAYSYYLIVAPVLLALIPLYLAPLITRERERDRFDLLRMSLMAPREILWGKTRVGVGAVVPALLAVLLALPLGFPKIWVDDTPRLILDGVVMVLVSVTFAVGLTAWVAVRCRNAAAAVTAIYVISVLQYVVGPGLTLVLRDMSSSVWGDSFIIAGFMAPYWSYWIYVAGIRLDELWIEMNILYGALGVVLWFAAARRYAACDA